MTLSIDELRDFERRIAAEPSTTALRSLHAFALAVGADQCAVALKFELNRREQLLRAGDGVASRSVVKRVAIQRGEA